MSTPRLDQPIETGARPAQPARQSTVPAVRAREVSKVFGSGANRVIALDSVQLRFDRGSFTAIMGPSGSGKSTLMHCLAGLDEVSGGEVWVGEDCLTGRSDSFITKVRRDRIGFVFQSFNLLPTLTARQNIVLPIELAGRKVDDRLVEGVAVSLGLGDRLDHRPSQLSGGQQQRVAVARALVGNPDVLFADEPTGALDQAAGRNLLSILRSACDERGQTIVMVTHDPVAASYADRVVMLRDGRVAGQIERPTVDSVMSAMRAMEE